jgi:flagellar biosynthesis/type III secretory pathway protein FliH
VARVIKHVKYEPNNRIALYTTASEDDPNVLESTMESPAEDGEIQSVVESPNTEALLSEAQSHVEMMLNQAQIQVATLRKEAQEAGWEAGYSKAHWVVANEMEHAITTLHRIIQSAIEAKAQFLREAQTELSQLAIAIARKIINKELSINPNVITDIVAQTIEAAGIQGACRIRVNPKDYELLRPHWDAVALLQQPEQSWELVADERMEVGDCLIETGGGTIDARIETQLEQISATFAKYESGNPAEISATQSPRSESYQR